MLRDAGVGATLLAAGVVLLAIQATADVPPLHHRQPLVRGCRRGTCAGVLRRRCVRAAGASRRAGAALALAALCGACVYALDLSAEYYAFALIAPAIALACAVRWAPAAWTTTAGAGVAR